MKFVNFDSSECELGWRFNDTLKANELDEIKAFYRDCFNEIFSPIRTVKVSSFSIAKTTFSWENLFDWEDEELDEVQTIEDFCLKINQGLKQYNWRLPTEDEFELACGGHLFSWGNSIPDGIPYGKETSFSKRSTLLYLPLLELKLRKRGAFNAPQKRRLIQRNNIKNF